VPPCGKETGLHNRSFVLQGTVADTKAALPCTGTAFVGGFGVNGLTDMSVGVPDAWAAFGYGAIPIYVTATTQYADSDHKSDWSHVVFPGNTVRVWGRYQYSDGVWYFIAKLVWKS